MVVESSWSLPSRRWDIKYLVKKTVGDYCVVPAYDEDTHGIVIARCDNLYEAFDVSDALRRTGPLADIHGPIMGVRFTGKAINEGYF